MRGFLRKLLTKFVHVTVIKNAESLLDVDLTHPDTFVDVQDLQIGFTTRQKLRQLESNGDISAFQRNQLLEAVIQFAVDTAKYVIKHFYSTISCSPMPNS